jgi:hypothetical protein
MSDPRPPDTEGVHYIGQACRAGQHHDCPGYWSAAPLYPGRGTRCACPCHEHDAPDKGRGYPKVCE